MRDITVYREETNHAAILLGRPRDRSFSESFWLNTSVWRTDRQTDLLTDRSLRIVTIRRHLM